MKTRSQPHKALRTIHLWTSHRFSLYARLSPHLVKTIHLFKRAFHVSLLIVFIDLKIVFLLLLLIFVIVNFLLPNSPYENIKNDILNQPKNPLFHFQLAEQLGTTNQFSESIHEYQQVKNLTSPRTPLYVEAQDQSFQIRFLQLQPSKIRLQIDSWQKITQDFPSFRDAFVKLAILNWKIYKHEAVKANLDQALSLDPNNSNLPQYSRLLTN